MKIGCGLYGPALLLDDDLWGNLKLIKDCGFSAIEPFVPLSNQSINQIPKRVQSVMWTLEQIVEMQPKLDEMGLKISSAHIAFMEDNPLDFVDEIILISKNTGISNFVTSMMVGTKEQADKVIILLNEMNEKLNSKNIHLHYHNHKMESYKMEYGKENISILEYMVKNTTDNVKFQLDTGWYMYGQSDVIEFLNKYHSKIVSVHLKDFIQEYRDVEKNNAFCAIGSGVLPLKEILFYVPKLKLMPYGLMIDQDYPKVGNKLIDDLYNGYNCVTNLL